MPKSKVAKQSELDALRASLSSAESFVLAQFQGLNMKDTVALRRKLRDQGVSFTVIKRTLLKKALAEKNVTLPDIESLHEGVAIAIGSEDVLAPAKILLEFSKKNEKVKLGSGYLFGDVLTVTQVKTLAQLPSKKELRAQLVGVIAGPLRGLLSTFHGTVRALPAVLAAKASKAS